MARKRKPGKREPNGRLSRKAEDQELTAAQINDNVSVAVQARMRVFGLTEAEARSPNAGTVIGRLMEMNIISAKQHTAAQYYLADHEAYHRSILAPGGVKTAKVAGSGDETSYETFCGRAKDRWEAVKAILAKACEEDRCKLPITAIELMIHRNIDAPYLYGYLRSALNRLVDHYLVGKRRAA